MIQNDKWLGLIYKLPSLPSKNRVYIWRKIKEKGAIYFQQGVATLPYQQEGIDFFSKLKEDIIRFGGEASIVSVNFLDEEDHARIIRQFNENIRAEYSKLEISLNRMRDDLDAIYRIHRMNVEYLESKLSILKNVKKDYEMIKKRDYFKFISNSELEKAIESVQTLVNNYINQVCAD